MAAPGQLGGETVKLKTLIRGARNYKTLCTVQLQSKAIINQRRKKTPIYSLVSIQESDLHPLNRTLCVHWNNMNVLLIDLQLALHQVTGYLP